MTAVQNQHHQKVVFQIAHAERTTQTVLALCQPPPRRAQTFGHLFENIRRHTTQITELALV